MHFSIRDDLVISLRKLLFFKSVESRQAATTGVLLLCRVCKVTGLVASQLSQSSGSLSQLTMDLQRGRSSTNSTQTQQTLCLELISVLRRCFEQQGEVRLVFYRGVVEVAMKNPELIEVKRISNNIL